MSSIINNKYILWMYFELLWVIQNRFVCLGQCTYLVWIIHYYSCGILKLLSESDMKLAHIIYSWLYAVGSHRIQIAVLSVLRNQNLTGKGIWAPSGVPCGSQNPTSFIFNQLSSFETLAFLDTTKQKLRAVFK